MDPDETRADVARRRLAQLAAAFDASIESEPEEVMPAPVTPRRTVGPTHVRVVGAVVVAAGVVLAWFLLAQRPQTAEPVEPVAAVASSTQSAELVVDVVGQVKKPGIVTVPAGSRVNDAIEAAGGLDGQVDTSGVNLARKLEDGEQIVVGPAAATGDVGTSSDGKIDLNRASVDQLDTLPGVGPVTAEAIIAWREEHGRFSSVDDLLDVKGIGDATLAELRDLVTA